MAVFPCFAARGVPCFPHPEITMTIAARLVYVHGEMQLMRTAESRGQRLVDGVSGALRLAPGIL